MLRKRSPSWPRALSLSPLSRSGLNSASIRKPPPQYDL